MTTPSPAQPTITVVSGSPTAEEVAVVVATLIGLSSGGVEESPRPPAAWGVAARVEATGAAPFRSSRDSRL